MPRTKKAADGAVYVREELYEQPEDVERILRVNSVLRKGIERVVADPSPPGMSSMIMRYVLDSQEAVLWIAGFHIDDEKTGALGVVIVPEPYWLASFTGISNAVDADRFFWSYVTSAFKQSDIEISHDKDGPWSVFGGPFHEAGLIAINPRDFEDNALVAFELDADKVEAAHAQRLVPPQPQTEHGTGAVLQAEYRNVHSQDAWFFASYTWVVTSEPQTETEANTV